MVVDGEMNVRFDRLETMLSKLVDGQGALNGTVQELGGSVLDLKNGQEALNGTVQELKSGQEALNGTVQALSSEVQELSGSVLDLKNGHANLELLITDVKESLEREMHNGFSSLNETLDDMATRLDRQSGLLRAGSQRIARLDEWAETVDKSLENKDREIADLRERVRRLEQKKSA